MYWIDNIPIAINVINIFMLLASTLYLLPHDGHAIVRIVVSKFE